MAFLVQTGRSIVSNEEKKRVREVVTDPELIDCEEVHVTDGDFWAETFSPSPEILSAKHQSDCILDEWISMLYELFDDDDGATCFIAKKLDDLKKSAILIACNFTDQTYRNVEKRIKDKVRKRFPQGFPWWEII